MIIMHSRKGISPLVAVIMLIAFTLVVAGVVASWATTFANSQREDLQFCTNARVLVYRGDYVPATNTLTLQVYNNGRVDLDLDAWTTYDNGTVAKHPAGMNITAGDIKPLAFTGVDGTLLEEATVQSRRCQGTQDLIKAVDIYGIGR